MEMDVCQCRIGNESPARTERHELIVDRVERDGSEAVSLSRITRNSNRKSNSKRAGSDLACIGMESRRTGRDWNFERT